jgi:DNA-binding transcriptional LysR family regulator
MDAHQGIEWDDLRYVLAVAEHGSLAGAARALGVNHTTVLRRIGAFERREGLRVFDRLPDGYALTAGGEELVAAARHMAETVTALERRLAGRDLRLEGTLRVTTTDTLMVSILGRHLAAFRSAHPGIVLEVAVSNRMFNLTKRDADIAIRPAVDPPGTLVGRRISALAFALYASPTYLAAQPDTRDLAAQSWVAPDESLADIAVARWMAALPKERIAFRADSLVALREAAASGIGIAALPCYLGDTDTRLVRVRRAPVKEIETALWLLTHADLRQTARVRAFMEFAAKALAAERGLLEGRRPLDPQVAINRRSR